MSSNPLLDHECTAWHRTGCQLPQPVAPVFDEKVFTYTSNSGDTYFFFDSNGSMSPT